MGTQTQQTQQNKKQNIMMKLAIISLAVATTSAFAPVATNTANRVGIVRAKLENEDLLPDQDQEIDNTPVVTPINGWVPDDNAPCYGLPGVVAPTGFFDPVGFSREGITLNEVKRYREAEVQHGRVAMLAVLGYFVNESFPGPFGLVGPANDQLQQLPLPVLIVHGLDGLNLISVHGRQRCLRYERTTILVMSD